MVVVHLIVILNFDSQLLAKS